MKKRIVALTVACILAMLPAAALAAGGGIDSRNGAPSLTLSGKLDHLFHVANLDGQNYLVENEFHSMLVWDDSPGDLIPIDELFALDPSWAVTVVGADGTPQNPHEDGTPIGTGDVITVTNEAGSDFLKVIIRGDLNGDGWSNIADIVRVAAAINGTAPLEGAMLWTADFNENGRVDAADLVKLVYLAFYTG